MKQQLYFNKKRVLTEAKGTGVYGYFGFTWRDIVGIIGYFVGQIVLSVLFMLIVLAWNFKNVKSSNSILEMIESNPIVLFGPFLIIGVGLFFLYWRELKQEARDFWRNKWRILITGVLIWIGALVFIIGYRAMMEFVFGFGEKTSENQQVLNEVFGKSGFMFIVFSVIIIPFIEEIIFRKILFTHLGNSVNYIVSSLVSVFVFGIIHVLSEVLVGDWISLITVAPSYLAIAVAITCTNYKTKNFFGGYFAHVLHNGMVTIIMIATMNMQ